MMIEKLTIPLIIIIVGSTLGTVGHINLQKHAHLKGKGAGLIHSELFESS